MVTYKAPGRYGIAVRVRVKPEVWGVMPHQSQKQAIRLATGERARMYLRTYYRQSSPPMLVVYQHNLNEFMDFIHGGR